MAQRVPQVQFTRDKLNAKAGEQINLVAEVQNRDSRGEGDTVFTFQPSISSAGEADGPKGSVALDGDRTHTLKPAQKERVSITLMVDAEAKSGDRMLVHLLVYRGDFDTLGMGTVAVSIR